MSEYDLNNPQSDVESYLANMDGILAPLPLPPESNVEKYLAHIVGVQGVELPNKPDSRVEAYLEKLALDPPQPVTPILVEKSITNNGVYSAGDDNADGYSKVTVEVPDPVLDDITITENGVYTSEHDGFDEVTVEVPDPVLDDITITENGVYTSEHDGFDEVTVEVEPPENSYQLKSITTPTSLATFNASAMPMPKLKVSVEAKQAGSGTPSPDNVRPISGRSEVVVSDVGKNLYDKNNASNQPNKRVSTGSGGTYTANGYTASYLVEVEPDTDYTLTTSASFVSYICWYDETQTRIGGTNWNSGTSKTSPSNAKYIRFDFGTADIDTVQLEYGSTATAYEPYNGTTTTISLPQTLYGAEVDVVNGVLRLTHEIKVYSGNSSEGWYADGTQSGSTYRMKASDVPSNIKLPSSNTDAMSAISNQFIAASADNIFLGNEGIGIPVNGSYLTIYDSVYNTNDVSLWKTHLASNPLQVVYELAEPIIINLTPTLIKSLDGTNNLSVESGDVIEGEYFKAL